MQDPKSLKKQIQKLEKKTTDLQVEIANHEYELTFDDSSHVSKILQHIDKDYQWQSKNAALAVYVYDKLRTEYRTNKVTQAGNPESGFSVLMKSTELTGLYNILLNINGTGIERARSFARLLTNVGQQVTSSMDKLAQRNEEVRKLHEELRNLEIKLQEVEITTTDEDSQQIKEETANSWCAVWGNHTRRDIWHHRL